MFYFMILATLLVSIAYSLQVPRLSKTETFREFRSYDPVRDTISFISNSFTDALSPLALGKMHKDSLYLPTMRKSQRLNSLRRAHKKHKWDYDDIASEFESHFVARAPQLNI